MIKAIFKTGLIAGSLDIAAAFLSAWLVNNVSPVSVLQFIASGVFGKEAFAGGYQMAFLGLAFHFVIAFCCTIAYFIIYPKWKLLQRQHHLINAILIALVAWVVTQLGVIPLSRASQGAFTLVPVIRSYLILVFCIGWPISVLSRKYYSNQGLNR